MKYHRKTIPRRRQPVTSASTGLSSRPERMRQLAFRACRRLAESIEVRGLLQTIVLRPRGANNYWLVFGRHRLEAVRHAATAIFAPRSSTASTLMGLACRDRRKSRARRSSPAERATAFGAAQGAFKKLRPETEARTRPEVARKGQIAKMATKTFHQRRGEQDGRSERTIQREVDCAAKISGLADIVGTSLDNAD